MVCDFGESPLRAENLMHQYKHGMGWSSLERHSLHPQWWLLSFVGTIVHGYLSNETFLDQWVLQVGQEHVLGEAIKTCSDWRCQWMLWHLCCFLVYPSLRLHRSASSTAWCLQESSGNLFVPPFSWECLFQQWDYINKLVNQRHLHLWHRCNCYQTQGTSPFSRLLVS